MKGWQVATVIGGVVVLGGVLFAVLRSGERGGITSRPPSKSSGTARLATFNVEGLFDQSDDPRLSGDEEDVPSTEEHLQAIAEAIRLVNADVLALEDVESLKAVEWFRDTYLEGMGYDNVVSEDVGHERGIENAVLSRYPIKASRVWPTLRLGGKHPSTAGDGPNPFAGQTLRFRRSPLMARVEMPDGKVLTLFVVEHKGGNKFDYWRKAEAEAVVGLAMEQGMSIPIVVLGSFHCDPKDPSLEAYLEAGFVDAMGVRGEPDRWATETTGDRTDFILANRVANGELDAEAGFVLGGKLAELREGGLAGATHLPVVIGVRLEER